MDFLAVVVVAEFFQQRVGRLDFADGFCPEKGWQAVLPDTMEALDLPLCLGRFGVYEAYAIEPQGCAQLGKGVWGFGVKKAVVIHIEGQRQAVLPEGSRDEVVVAQEHLALIKASASDHAGAVVENLDEVPAGIRARHESVWSGVHLPQLADALPLPPADAGPLLPAQGALGQSASMGQRPATHAGAIRHEGDAAMEFAGHQTVGGGRIAFEKLAGQLLCRYRPRLMVRSAAAPRLPEIPLAIGARTQVGCAIAVESTLAQIQLVAGLARIDSALTVKFKKVPHKRRGMAVMELTIFFLDIARQCIPQHILPEAFFPRGPGPRTPGVFRFGPGLISPPKKEAPCHTACVTEPFGEDQPLD